jgi:hypothetical protein
MGERAGMSLHDGFDLLGIDADELWSGYAALGGTLPPVELELFLLDRTAAIDAREHDIIAHALNEAFLERGLATYPVRTIGAATPLPVLVDGGSRKRGSYDRKRVAELHIASARLHTVAAALLAECGRLELAANAQRRANSARQRARRAEFFGSGAL